MIVVKVELHSAVTGEVSEIARMHIINDGSGTRTRGNYHVRTLKGQSTEAFERQQIQRSSSVINYPRLSAHVWNLVTDALANMGYGLGISKKQED